VLEHARPPLSALSGHPARRRRRLSLLYRPGHPRGVRCAGPRSGCQAHAAVRHQRSRAVQSVDARTPSLAPPLILGALGRQTGRGPRIAGPTVIEPRRPRGTGPSNQKHSEPCPGASARWSSEGARSPRSFSSPWAVVRGPATPPLHSAEPRSSTAPRTHSAPTIGNYLCDMKSMRLDAPAPDQSADAGC
jgi:hypothetical protein